MSDSRAIRALQGCQAQCNAPFSLEARTNSPSAGAHPHLLKDGRPLRYRSWREQLVAEADVAVPAPEAANREVNTHAGNPAAQPCLDYVWQLIRNAGWQESQYQGILPVGLLTQQLQVLAA
jgi:hypothetical protein